MRQHWNLLWWLAATVVVGCPVLSTSAAPSKGPETHRLVVDPAAEPRPALRHALFPEVVDQLSGNAALAYQEALQLHLQNKEWNQDMAQCSEWLDDPLAELAVGKVTELVSRYQSAQKHLRRATRYEQCDWQIPIREEGFNALMPHLAGVRNMSRLLATGIRLHIAQGRHDRAIEDIRTGLTMARHVGRGVSLIEGLVGAAIAGQMLDRVEELIQQPKAPNLYWALTDLPPAFLDVWHATRWERCSIYTMVPSFRKTDERGVTTADLQRMIAEFTSLGESIRGAEPPPLAEQDRLALMTTLGALAVYPRARQYLAEQGRSPADLDRLPVAEVLIRYIRDQYEFQRDNVFKWFALPYAQAAQGLARARTEFVEAVRRDPVGNFLGNMLLPALGHASRRFGELDRKFALLRCIEAIRMQAAAGPRVLPATLEEVNEAPCPHDPMTGQPFPYRLENDTALIEIAPLPGQRPARGLSYQITLRK
ncbi:MAG: hypothetical protein JXQ71_06680 [Verrucomicrobia bacterium]|nr:hypothetical protein [Verrucomicrobiota bacterium]